ncbi:PHP domain-containing protein [Candidatus Daviesbacteria bacterium]|nr:PHP domain-containing protein [Candidatus Daviesbacteria bacterium]
MKGSNADVANLLKSVATAITLSKGNFFEIRAYNSAADAIEHSTSEIKDLWQEGKLGDIPGVGKSIQSYLEEYFKTGKVKHFDSLLGRHPAVIYELIKIPGIGPATALDLSKIGVKSIDDLKEKIESGKIIKDGLSEKLSEKIGRGLLEINSRTGRMLLPYAFSQAEKILEYLKKSKDVIEASPLGSLRRMVVTIGDLDFAVSSKNPSAVVDHFIKMPGVKEIQGQGESKASIVLESGLHVDLLVGEPDSYGALLQHFTGSKHHNVHLRSIALDKGLSLSEYGLRKVVSGKSLESGEVIHCKTEDNLYEILGMQTPPPEIREDTGEIEAALIKGLPGLVNLKDIKGDFHLHSNFPIDSSHDYGTGSPEEIIKKGIELGYKYVGLSDHAPALGTHTKEEILKLIEKRKKVIQELQTKYKSIRVLNGLEIDIASDGSLTVPEDSLKLLDYTVVGIHTGHKGSKESITKRILTALESPYATILAHPTGRLINERDSYDADWEEIFKIAAKNKKFLEINSYPNRLDLRDDLIRMALKFGVEFIINTDSHSVEQMVNMPFGVSVARRGWATKKDIGNTWDWKDLRKWFTITKES